MTGRKELMKRSTGEHLGPITISIGVATLRKDDSAQPRIERTDEYQAAWTQSRDVRG